MPTNHASCQVCQRRRPERDWDGSAYTKCRRCDKLVNEKGLTWQMALQEIEARDEAKASEKPQEDFNLWRGER